MKFEVWLRTTTNPAPVRVGIIDLPRASDLTRKDWSKALLECFTKLYPNAKIDVKER